jgi:alginate O-acetyltransferase complex protein AlgI
MDLTSPLFLFLFLPVFILLYSISLPQLRLPLVLIGSIVFLTTAQWTASLWLGGLMLVSYGLGLVIARAKDKGQSGAPFMWLGVSINIALLASFKFLTSYGPTVLPSVAQSLVVPLGLSYVTFQAIAYLVDVWRGNTVAERNILHFGAYLLFFPKLISGPLMRYKPFSEQFGQLIPSSEQIASGVRRLLFGFIKRVLIANQLALVADAVFNIPVASIQPGFAWLGLLAFTLQIFFDFSGYTDMAIGLGLMIGIRMPENFNYPYISQSVSEFWRRWHITLGTWFREYVFFPLERRRLKWAGQQVNIVIIFLLTGLWHGFKPTFIAWGLLYGIAIAIESAGLGRWLKTTWRPLRHFYTLIIVLIGWVFFRSENLRFALGFFGRLAGDSSNFVPLPFSQTTPLPFIEPSFMIVLVVAILFSLPLSQLWDRFRTHTETTQPATYFGFQITQDVVMIALFILGLAAVLSTTFIPNLYAQF